MTPHLILAVAGLTSAWAMFSIIGGERERALQQAELLRRSRAEADAGAPAGNSAGPDRTAAPAAATRTGSPK